MTLQQRKTIFGLSKGLNMDNDELHLLAYGLTGKESLTELSDGQAETVIRELRGRSGQQRFYRKEKPRPQSVPGMMTAEQQSLAWRLMYRLQELDDKPKLHEDGSSVTVGERMAGAIEKVLGITAIAGKDIFKWVSFEDGSKLIEYLKRYVRSAEKKQEIKKQDARTKI